MSETYYKQIPCTEHPKEGGKYLTNIGPVIFVEKGTQENFESYWFGTPEWWLEPVELPIEPKSMSLEEAKDKVAQDSGYNSWRELYEKRGYYGPTTHDYNKAAELYHSTNSAAMQEEIMVFKSQCIEDEFTIGFIENQKGKLERQVKVLSEALEKIKSNPLAPKQFCQIAREALSTINQ